MSASDAMLRQLDEGIAKEPRNARLHLERGRVLLGLERLADALNAFRRATVLEPQSAEMRHELGRALRRSGRLPEAVVVLREAAQLAPTDPTLLLNLGAALLETGRRTEAIAAFRQALEREPERRDAWNILGAALADDGQLSAAETTLRRALEGQPDYAAARNNLARVYRAQGRVAEAVAEYRAALAAGADASTHSNLVYALNFLAVEPDAILAEHKTWAERHAEPLTRLAAPWAPEVSAERRLRVGFVSPDLVNHAVAYFLEPLLAKRDRATWTACCYSDAAAPDRVTQRLRALSDQWRDTAALGDEALDLQIRRDRIDILIDLAGHTARNRLRVFARRPAPLQVTWLGYPNTTGLSAIDFRITDALADPVGMTERWHSEQLFRMPRVFLAYEPPAESPPVAEPPASQAGCVTFGSFSNYAKISDDCVSVWSAVLRAVAGARLLLKSRGLGDAETAASVRARFAAHGIAAERIELDGKLVGTQAHLGQYGQVDIALDPFPYNGTTTTCEALWMGVPVITLAGRTHVSRVGVSLLTQLGHPEWIAQSNDEYVERAVALARQGTELAAVRKNLRAQMQASPLCDAAGFAGEFGTALQTMWRAKYGA